MGSVVRRAVLAAIATAAIVAYFVVGASAGDISKIGTSCLTSYPVDGALSGTGANLPPSCFDAGNGDVSTSNTNLFDWTELATFTHDFSTSGGNFIDDNSPADIIFSNGSKEQDQSTWSLTQSSPPAKDDINHVASYNESVSDPSDAFREHDFFYGAFDRASNNGDVNLDFEFNQGGATSGSNITGAEFPVRQTGDLLITFDGNSSSGSLRLGACVWFQGGNTNTGWYPIGDGGLNPPPSGDLLKGSDVCTQINAGTLPAGIGSINSQTIDASAITNSSSSFGSALLHDEFGEVAIDLTGAIEQEASPSPCVNFGTGFIHTRPSEAVANELKDYVAPFGLKPAGTCGVTVIKHVVNAHGGTKSASDFTMDVSGSNATGSDVSGSSVSGSDLTFPGDENGTFVPLDEGPYNVDEGAHAGYTESRSAGCSGTVVANQPATCTITNTDIAPQLTVIKHVINNDGGTETASDFTMLVSGTNISGSNLTAQSGGVSFPGVDGAGKTVTLDAGSFNVDEGDHAGYTETMSAGCSGTIALGDHKTCTITNDDIAPTLTVIKHVVNDNGGTKSASDFTMLVTGTNVSDPSFAGDESGTDVTLSANQPYTVGEGSHAGYTETPSATGCSGSLPPGGHAVCTITNDDIAPQLIVQKIVNNNHGGTKTSSDFTMVISGGHVDASGISGSGTSGSNTTIPGNASGSTVTLDQGAFDVTEGSVHGYQQVSAVGCTGTISVGETKTCTITNADIAPQLVVQKIVENHHGGTLGSSDFTMVISGGHVDASGVPGNGTSGSNTTIPGSATGSTVTLDQGDYSVGEGTVPGYQQVSASADCSGTISVGDVKTCTITNADIAPQLTIKKIVENNHGGTKSSSDFTMVISGSNVDTTGISGAGTSGSNATIPGSHDGTTVTLDQGGFDVTEGAVHGYQQVSAVGCTGTISVGETKTCTITNADIAPQLTVIKHVINDDGGTATASDFTMLVSGANIAGSGLTSQSGGVSFPGADGSGKTVTLDAGDYNVGEVAQSGYLGTPSSDCSGSIGVGDSKTCTITNDDVPATLTVIKHVVNEAGSTGKASDFTMEVSASNVTGSDITTTTNGASFPGDESGTNVGLDSGAYSVDEGSHDGYTETLSEGCSGTLPPGGHATCTITNTRQTGTITVVKHLSPSSDPGTFDLFVDSDAVASAVGDGGSGSEVVTTGTHTVKETASLGSSTTLDEYVKSIVCTKPGEEGATTVASTDGNDAGPLEVPVGSGDQITCTVSNRRIQAGIAVKKTGPAFAYDGDRLTYTYAVTSTGTDPVTVDTVSDDKCSPVTGPISKQNDDGDNLLDKVGVDGVNPEVWIFTCTTTAPPSKIGDPPIVNTVTVTGHDQFGHQVQATDQWSVPRLHPGISIVKTGPASATAGDLVTYTLNVKDTGDTAFPDTGVVLTDALCQAPPALQSKNGDGSPATLDPGETWTYTCSVQSQPGQTLIDNVGKVQGTDIHGRVVNDQSEAKTVLNQQAVAPVRIGSAKLRGSQGCIARNRAQASVRGQLIAKVTFYLDGKRVKTLRKPNAGKTTYKLTVSGKKLRFGAHRVKAVITFQSGVTPKTKTLALTFTRCAPAKPKFTG